MKLSPVLLGAILGGAIGLMAMPELMASRAALRLARSDAAAAAGAARRPQTGLLAPALRIAAVSPNAAGDRLASEVRRLAAQGGVLVEQAEPVARRDALIGVRVRLSGSEGAVLTLADSIESGRPFARLATWRIEGQGASVRLSGEVVASWR